MIKELRIKTIAFRVPKELKELLLQKAKEEKCTLSTFTCNTLMACYKEYWDFTSSYAEEKKDVRLAVHITEKFRSRLEYLSKGQGITLSAQCLKILKGYAKGFI